MCARSGGTAATAGGPTCVWRKYHVIRGEPPCARRHQDGEFLGTGKRRVEGRKVKGGTKRANRYTQGRRASPPCGNGTGSMRAELSIEAACLIVFRGVGCKKTLTRVLEAQGTGKPFLPSRGYMCACAHVHIHGSASLSHGTRGIFFRLETSPRDGCRSPPGISCGVLSRRHVVASNIPSVGGPESVERPGET